MEGARVWLGWSVRFVQLQQGVVVGLCVDFLVWLQRDRLYFPICHTNPQWLQKMISVGIVSRCRWIAHTHTWVIFMGIGNRIQHRGKQLCMTQYIFSYQLYECHCAISLLPSAAENGDYGVLGFHWALRYIWIQRLLIVHEADLIVFPWLREQHLNAYCVGHDGCCCCCCWMMLSYGLRCFVVYVGCDVTNVVDFCGRSRAWIGMCRWIQLCWCWCSWGRILLLYEIHTLGCKKKEIDLRREDRQTKGEM